MGSELGWAVQQAPDVTAPDTRSGPGTAPVRGRRGERTPATSRPLFPWRLGNQERFKCNFTSATQRETQQAPQASLGRSWKGKCCSFEKTMKERASKINTLTPWQGRPQGVAVCGFRITDRGFPCGSAGKESA